MSAWAVGHTHVDFYEPPVWTGSEVTKLRGWMAEPDSVQRTSPAHGEPEFTIRRSRPLVALQPGRSLAELQVLVLPWLVLALCF